MVFPIYNALVGAGVAAGFLIADHALRGKPERTTWPYLCLLGLCCGAVGAACFSRLAGVSDAWHRPAFGFLGGVLPALAALVIGGAVARLRTLVILDAAALGLSAGHVLGRLGCWLGGCCYGKWFALSPALGWGFQFPTPLLEAFAELAIFLHLRRRAPALAPHPGLLAARWMLLYGGLRFVLESTRGDFRGALPGLLSGASPSQVASLLLIVLGLVVPCVIKRLGSVLEN